MEAFGAFMVGILPYITPIIGILLVYLANRLTSAITANQNANTAARSAASFALKASIVVAAVEQKNRKAFADACADGKITKEEGAALAMLAVKGLLEAASADLDGMGVSDPAARERIATAAVEAQVFALPHKNRIRQVTATTAAGTGGIK